MPERQGYTVLNNHMQYEKIFIIIYSETIVTQQIISQFKNTWKINLHVNFINLSPAFNDVNIFNLIYKKLLNH